MSHILYVFIGGGIGSLLRYGLSTYLNPVLQRFPLGTMAANIFACLLLGLFSGWVIKGNTNDAFVKYFLIIGLCGGFSTFSTYILEINNILRDGFWSSGTLYLSLSIILGVLALIFGIQLTKGGLLQ